MKPASLLFCPLFTINSAYTGQDLNRGSVWKQLLQPFIYYEVCGFFQSLSYFVSFEHFICSEKVNPSRVSKFLIIFFHYGINVLKYICITAICLKMILCSVAAFMFNCKISLAKCNHLNELSFVAKCLLRICNQYRVYSRGISLHNIVHVTKKFITNSKSIRGYEVFLFFL